MPVCPLHSQYYDDNKTCIWCASPLRALELMRTNAQITHIDDDEKPCEHKRKTRRPSVNLLSEIHAGGPMLNYEVTCDNCGEVLIGDELNVI